MRQEHLEKGCGEMTVAGELEVQLQGDGGEDRVNWSVAWRSRQSQLVCGLEVKTESTGLWPVLPWQWQDNLSLCTSWYNY